MRYLQVFNLGKSRKSTGIETGWTKLVKSPGQKVGKTRPSRLGTGTLNASRFLKIINWRIGVRLPVVSGPLRHSGSSRHRVQRGGTQQSIESCGRTVSNLYLNCYLPIIHQRHSAPELRTCNPYSELRRIGQLDSNVEHLQFVILDPTSYLG